MSQCFYKIKESLPGLTKKEKMVAEFVLDFPDEVIGMSIEQLAESSGTSPSSVVRLCKTLGYKGYREFCRVIASEAGQFSKESVTYEDIRPGDSVQTIVRSVSMCNIRAIENSLNIADFEQFEKAIECIYDAKRVDFYGVGNSGLVALDAHNKFLRIDKMAFANPDPHVQVISASSLKKGDVAVFISYTGETKDMLTILDVASKTGATIISVTRYGKNTLSDGADIRLYAASTETLIRSGAMSSRISQLNIIDILYTGVISRDYDRSKPLLDKTRFTTGKMRTSLK